MIIFNCLMVLHRSLRVCSLFFVHFSFCSLELVISNVPFKRWLILLSLHFYFESLNEFSSFCIFRLWNFCSSYNFSFLIFMIFAYLLFSWLPLVLCPCFHLNFWAQFKMVVLNYLSITSDACFFRDIFCHFIFSFQ